MAKEVTVTVRVTPAQKEELKEQAADFGISLSSYSRKKWFDFIPDPSGNLQELKAIFLQVQNRINEIARGCYGDDTFTQSDYQELLNLLNGIDEKYYELVREMKRNNQQALQKSVGEGVDDGDHKTDSD